jgi:hypothetical protein
MELNKNQPHSLRRIVLPSGKSIEVVRFEETQAPIRPGPHVCPRCQSELVQPVSWSESPGDRWELTLECPNCWWADTGLFERDEVDQLEECLDDGLAKMLCDLKRLTHANMADEVDRFTAALHAGHILPEDF